MYRKKIGEIKILLFETEGSKIVLFENMINSDILVLQVVLNSGHVNFF